MATGKIFEGIVFGFAGDFEWPTDKPWISQIIRDNGGAISPGYTNVDILLVGDDPGNKVNQSRDANPNVLIWKSDRFIKVYNSGKRPELPKPTPGPIPESYGSF